MSYAESDRIVHAIEKLVNSLREIAINDPKYLKGMGDMIDATETLSKVSRISGVSRAYFASEIAEIRGSFNTSISNIVRTQENMINRMLDQFSSEMDTNGFSAVKLRKNFDVIKSLADYMEEHDRRKDPEFYNPIWDRYHTLKEKYINGWVIDGPPRKRRITE